MTNRLLRTGRRCFNAERNRPLTAVDEALNHRNIIPNPRNHAGFFVLIKKRKTSLKTTKNKHQQFLRWTDRQRDIILLYNKTKSSLLFDILMKHS